MALLAAAGSYYYQSSSIQYPPWVWDIGGGAFSATGDPALGFISSSFFSFFGNPFLPVGGDQHATMNIGFAAYFNDLVVGEYPICGVSVDSGSTFTAQLYFYKSSGAYGLRVKQGSTVIADTGTGSIGITSRYYIEWQIVLGTASNGSTKIYINEVQRATASSVTTSSSGTVWNGIAFHSNGANMTYYIDDIYLTNGAGSSPLNTTLGDVVVAIVGPSADATPNQWSSFLSNHYKSLNNSFSDSAFLSDATPSHREVFDSQAAPPVTSTGFAAIGPGETYTSGKQVYAVISTVRARAGELPRKMSHGFKVGVNESLTEIQLTDSFANYYTVYDVSPGGAAWTTTDLDNLQLIIQTGDNT